MSIDLVIGKRLLFYQLHIKTFPRAVDKHSRDRIAIGIYPFKPFFFGALPPSWEPNYHRITRQVSIDEFVLSLSPKMITISIRSTVYKFGLQDRSVCPTQDPCFVVKLQRWFFFSCGQDVFIDLNCRSPYPQFYCHLRIFLHKHNHFSTSFFLYLNEQIQTIKYAYNIGGKACLSHIWIL